MKLEDRIRNIIEEECEDYFFGVVDLSDVENDIIGQYGSFFDEYPLAISIGITMPYMVTDDVLMGNTAIYNETNCKLKTIALHLSSLLQDEGYKALSVPKAKINDEMFISLHKLAANLANLGEIKKNLVVTPEVGTGVNWGTVLTDAPIETVNL